MKKICVLLLSVMLIQCLCSCSINSTISQEKRNSDLLNRIDELEAENARLTETIKKYESGPSFSDNSTSTPVVSDTIDTPVSTTPPSGANTLIYNDENISITYLYCATTEYDGYGGIFFDIENKYEFPIYPWVSSMALDGRSISFLDSDPVAPHSTGKIYYLAYEHEFPTFTPNKISMSVTVCNANTFEDIYSFNIVDFDLTK